MLDSEIEMVEIEKLVSKKSCKILTIRCICSRQMSLWIICHLLLSKTMQLGMYIYIGSLYEWLVDLQ